ncbi:MAG: radical SAM family heme chaperone HemW [Ignavibacteria bacterium]
MSGIYIHIPFCDTKCIYCDFYSITNHSLKEEYLDSISKEIRERSSLLGERKFDTIFIGGGTPSLLSYDELASLFEVLFHSLNISDDSEITIEANPGTLDRKKLKEFKKLPVNRISFGVQSFIDAELKFLTRIHNSTEAVNSITDAMDSGFSNINLDLIFAIPGQSQDSWKYNLEKAVSLDTQHISAYSLIFEEGTPLYTMLKKNKVKSADNEIEREMYDHTMKYLNDCGYIQYEISNYAKPGFECRHNLKYWMHEEYIGFGASAASYIDNYRWLNVRNIEDYIKRITTGQNSYDLIEYIDTDTSVYEYIFLGLRSKGINFKIFNKTYNIDFREKYSNTLELLTKNGFASIDDDFIRLTPKGYAVCDEIIASYF